MTTAPQHPGHQKPASPFRQPKAVWAVAFACVISFMGIGLVDPILPSLASELHASPTQVELLFTSYLVITSVAMLVTGWVSSRLGAKRTLIAGLILIVAFSALAGSAGSIGGIIGFRAGWGLGNALFIATSLAVIVGSASGGFGGAIVLYEAALGIGIAVGPLLGGLLGSIGWQWPFFGVAGLMAIALVATITLVAPTPKPTERTSLAAPLKALKHRSLRTLSLMALAYNWGFFTLLGYTPFPMHLESLQLGLVFTGWGICVAIFAVFGAPRLKARFGTVWTLYASFILMAVDLAVIAAFPSSQVTLICAVIVSGVFVGTNNTLVTSAVMTVSPVDRSVASAAYGFVRFIGGGLAPFVAGILVEAFNIRVPFAIGAAALIVAALILRTGSKLVTAAENETSDDVVSMDAPEEAHDSVTPVAATPGRSEDTGAPVVVAVDRLPNAEAVVDAGIRLAAESASPIELVHVRESEVVHDQDVDLETAAEAEAIVRAHLERIAASGAEARGHVLNHVGAHAELGRVIAECARDWGARLLVVGPAGRASGTASGRSSALPGLWEAADCDLFLVRTAAEHATVSARADGPRPRR